MWEMGRVCVRGTRNCVGWGLEARAVENGSLALTAPSPRFCLPLLGSARERGGGIVGLGPASEPPLAVARVSS